MVAGVEVFTLQARQSCADIAPKPVNCTGLLLWPDYTTLAWILACARVCAIVHSAGCSPALPRIWAACGLRETPCTSCPAAQGSVSSARTMVTCPVHMY